MESSIRIDNVDKHGLASEQPTEVRPTVATASREACANCAAPLAADQRYCTECGQRRGAPRLPFMDGVAERAPEDELVAVPRRPVLTANSTWIAGIATLLLAMGIGVLIGRTGSGSSSRTPAPVQVVTVAGAGASGAVGPANAPATGKASTPRASAAAAAAGAARAKATHTATKGIFTTKAPPPKVVTVGSPGKGPGYQGGKFTGQFFGQ